MKTLSPNRRAISYEALTTTAALFSLAVGGVVLFGWLFDISTLKSILPVWISMKANTALCFMLLGAGLFFINKNKPKLFLSRLFASFVIALALLTLSEYVFGTNLGIDELIFKDEPNAVGTIYPGRMANNTAFCFMLLGIALFLYSGKRTPRFPAIFLLTLLPGTLALFALVGYPAGLDVLSALTFSTKMAFHTAITFIVISSGVFFAHPEVRRQHTSLERKVRIGFGIAFLVIVTLWTFSLFQLNALINDSVEVRQIQETINHLDQTLGKLVDVETGARGFFITRNEEFLEPFTTRKNAVPEHISTLRILMAGEHSFRKSIDTLEQLARRRIALSSSLIDTIQIEKLSYTERFALLQTGRAVMDSIRFLIEKMKLTERNNLETHLTEQNSSFNRTFIVTLFGIAIQLSIFVLLYLFISRDITGRQRAEETLKSISSELQDLYNNAPCGYHSLDAEGTIIQINDTELQWLGYERNEVEGKKRIIEFFTPEAQQSFRENFPVFKQQGFITDLEFEMVRKDGTTFPILLSATAMKDAQGNFLRSRTSVFDISTRKIVEEKLNSFFSLSLDMLCIAGYDGYFKRLNRVWEKVLGYSVDELCLQPYIEFVHPDDVEATKVEAQKLTQGIEVVSFENRYRCKDGTYKWFLWSATMSSKFELIFAAARDITERKRSEEELHKLNELLKTANKELEAFSYSVSHDLRAPLRHIVGYVELLHKHAVTLDEKGKRFLNVISNAAKTMGLLIDDLLSFSRMGRVEMIQKKINLNEIVSDVVQSFDNETNQRNIQWNIQQLPVISCDNNLLRVVFMNLISNAVKYTRNQPSPVIEIGSGKNHINEIEVFVKDNGAGFNPKYIDKLFGVFQRLHTDAEFEGTGIGLATVRRIIQRHNGRTWAEGEVGKGATFYFSLPYSENSK